MLKVNTEKISVEEFAKKYGFKRGCLDHSYESDTKGKLKSWSVFLFDGGNLGFVSVYHIKGWTQGGENLVEFFYDMIVNGDVINVTKEAK